MKKLLILLILLFALPAYAQQCSEENSYPQVARLGAGLGGGVPVVGASCDDCSGNLGLSWHAENSNNADAGVAPNCGCSDGATDGTDVGVIAYSGTAQSGSYSVILSADDYVYWTSAGANDLIGVTNTGGMCIYAYSTDWSRLGATGISMMGPYYDASNYATVYALWDGTNVDTTFRFSGADPGADSQSSAKNNKAWATSTWIRICFSWDLPDKFWTWVDWNGDGIDNGGDDEGYIVTGSANPFTAGASAGFTLRAGDCDIYVAGDPSGEILLDGFKTYKHYFTAPP